MRDVRCHSELLKYVQASRGAVLPLLALIVVAVLGIVALMVDQGRQEISLAEIQSCSDAASLAGARMFDSTDAGWVNAKRAALQVLKTCGVRGTPDSLANLTPSSTSPDPIEPTDSPFLSNDGVVGDIDVSIQRGFYRQKSDSADPDHPEFEFVRLDNIEPIGDKTPIYQGVPILSIANAVKIELAVNNFATTIAKAALGNKSLGTLKRQSIAVNDENTEICVAPIAIPACSLFLNTKWRPTSEVNDLDKIFDPSAFDASRQCSREIVAAEADTEVPQRWDGIARSQWYPRPPYYRPEDIQSGSNTQLSKTSVPIRAVLGVPDSIRGVASPQEVANTLIQFASGTRCIKARLGMHLRPLDSLFQVTRQSDGTVTSGTPVDGLDALVNNTQLDNALASAINGGMIFKDAFKNPPQNPSIDPDSNYPYLRHYRYDLPNDPNIELKLLWPKYTSLGLTNYGKMYLKDMGSIENYVNPLCHSNKVLHPNDPENARALKVNIMVVAPESDEVDYCDFKSLFAGEQQHSVAPTSSTKPVVIGFLKANFFDFNFRDLTKPTVDGLPIHYGTTKSPVYKDKDGIIDKDIYDANPRTATPTIRDGEGEVESALKDYRAAFNDYLQCRRDAISSGPPGSCECGDKVKQKLKEDSWEDSAGGTTCKDLCWSDHGIGYDYSQCTDDPYWCPEPMPMTGNPADCNPAPSAYDQCRQDYINYMYPTAVDECLDGNECTKDEDENLICHPADPDVSSATECMVPSNCHLPLLPDILKDSFGIEDDTSGELQKCLKECGPNPDFSTCSCLTDFKPASGYRWDRTCFKYFRFDDWSLPRPLQGLWGLQSNGVWEVHPLFSEPFTSAFWEAPAVYYKELKFIADIIDEPFPTLQQIVNGGSAALNTALTNLTEALNTKTPSRPKYDKYYQYGRRWDDIMRSPNVRQYFSEISNRYPQHGPEENSYLFDSLANIFGEDLDTRGMPVIPVIPGTADSRLLEDSQADLIAETLMDLKHFFISRTLGGGGVNSPLMLDRLVALPGMHCLPLKYDDKFPVSDPTSWQQPTDRSPQFGCGGMRIRMDCDASDSFTSLKTATKRRPALVREN